MQATPATRATMDEFLARFIDALGREAEEVAAMPTVYDPATDGPCAIEHPIDIKPRPPYDQR